MADILAHFLMRHHIVENRLITVQHGVGSQAGADHTGAYKNCFDIAHVTFLISLFVIQGVYGYCVLTKRIKQTTCQIFEH